MVQRLLATRRDVFPHYDLDQFVRLRRPASDRSRNPIADGWCSVPVEALLTTDPIGCRAHAGLPDRA